jgi:MFS family permease
LGFNAAQNGTIFVSIGLIGAITQGVLIGPLTKKFGSTNLLGAGILLAGLGLSSIPYVTIDLAWIGLISVTGFVAFGNGIAAPSRATLLTRYSGKGELGIVMGVAESLRAMSSIVGVLLGGIVWDLTVDRTDMFDYHTAFRLCGIFALIGFCIFRFSKAWHAELDESE